MKILHAVEFYSPSVGGAQEVVRRVSEALVRRGHDVTVATTRLPARTERKIGGVRIEEFDVSGNAARGIVGDTESYRRFVLDGPWDVDAEPDTLPEAPQKRSHLRFACA